MSAQVMPTTTVHKPQQWLKDLIELTKPRLSMLVLLTATGGLALSGKDYTLTLAFATIFGTTLVVAGANTLNNYLERESDQYMARTANRPLPSGRMAPITALLSGLALSAVSIFLLTFLANPITGLLAAIALVLYVVVYTPLKRRSSFNTMVGAIPGAMPPLIGWTAATGSIDPGGLALFALLFLWQIPHSLAIAIYRRTEYDRAGIVLLPSAFGEELTRRQIFLHTLAVLPVPLILVHMGIAGTLTFLIGTVLGLWWLRTAWDGYTNKKGAKWARKFFLGSLVYLSGLFVTLTVDMIV